MKKSEIKVGSHYRCKVSGQMTTVKITSESEYGGWNATNVATGRSVRIKSAQRLRDVASNVTINGPLTDGQHRLNQVTNTHPKHSLGDKLRRRKDTGVCNAPHVIVEARAGTGKTTTLVEGLKRVKDMDSPLTPSPQQAVVWEAMEQSKGRVQSICFVAFNKSIATELQRRVPEGCDAMTMHSMGYKAVQRAFGRQQPNNFVVPDMIADEIEKKDLRELRKHHFESLKAAERLVSLSKMNLLGFNEDGTTFDAEWVTDDDLFALAAGYDIDLNGDTQRVFDWVRECLRRMTDPKGRITFDDMIWLPVVCNLSVPKYDLLLVDEAQDLNRCQQALALKAGRRLILCGDPKQAIYGFAGADSRSMERMEETLGATERGCVHLPLTVTRRCGKAIVAEAQRYVPDFEAHETNGHGGIRRKQFKEVTQVMLDDDGEPINDSYAEYVEDGDMCLCRVNAPLVSQCFRFLKAGRKATIQGRDVGQGLISTVKKSKANDVGDFLEWLSNWYQQECQKESKKRNPNEQRLIALEDRKECLECFCEDETAIAAVIAKIERIFSDNDTDGVKFSSIHKAKGLEAKRVFFLEPEGASCPHPMARTPQAREQELNLRYVAITRAIEELVYVN